MHLSADESNFSSVITAFLTGTFFDLALFQVLHFRRMFELYLYGANIREIYFSSPIDSIPTSLSIIVGYGMIRTMSKSIRFVCLIKRHKIDEAR